MGLLPKIQSDTDQAKRQAMIDRAFEVHKTEVGHLPLHQQPLSWGVRYNIDLAQRPDNVFYLRYTVVK